MLPDQAPVPRGNESLSDIIIPSRDEAVGVLDMMREIIDLYEVTSVGDYKEMLGIPTNHVDQTWGWTDLSQAQIRQTREGYLIDLPPVETL